MPGGKIITIGSEPAITQTFESAQEDVEWRAAGRDAVKMFDGDPLSGPFDEPDNELVVMMRSGTRTVLSMQNDYKGPPSEFALVIPVPVVLKEADVKTLGKDVFDRVEKMGAPRLVEYWEQDPCYVEREYDEEKMEVAASAPRKKAKASGDEDDDLGVRGLLSWLEDGWVVVGLIVLVVYPIVMLLLLGVVAGAWWRLD